MKEKSKRGRKLLEIMHFDIYRTINPIWNEGKRYHITFIIDLSRKTWVYFLKEHCEALSNFKNYKTIVDQVCK